MNRAWIARYLRTLGRLSPVQIVHRARLRSRTFLRKRLPDLAERHAARLAVATPPLVGSASVPLDLLRPCPESVWRQRAREVASGRFTFLGETRELALSPFPAPESAPLLWAYHLEYMEYVLDLALSGEWEVAERLVMSRLGTGADAGIAAMHPYTESRRAAVWLQVVGLAPTGLRRALAAGAWRSVLRVDANLELDVGGNHLLENGLALALGGARFTGRRAASLRRRGRRVLCRGITEQVLPDGAHYELSPMYHARVLALAVEGAIALEGAGEVMPGGFWERLAAMAGFLRGILDTRGRMPLLGDCARDPFLDPEMLLTAVERRLPVRPPRAGSADRACPNAGIYLFEDRGRENLLVLDAGPTCPVRLPAHGQADTFAATLSIGGVEMITDAGLYEYAPGGMRDWCRSTRAHSTVEVDGKNSSEVWSSFRVGRAARVRDAYWSADGGLATFSALHDGYRDVGVIHRRLVTHPEPGVFVVCDEMTADKTHRYVSRLHLHPDVSVDRVGPKRFRVRREGRELRISAYGGGVIGWEDGWHCPGFGERMRSRLLTLTSEGRRGRFGFVLSDRDLGDASIDSSGSVRVGSDSRVVARSPA